MVWFYSISTILGYLMPNPLYTYILNIYDCKYNLLKTLLNDPNLILLYRVKWFQVLLCITNNSFKHQSFVYTQLNDQTILFQTIQFSISHLFAHSLNVKQFYLIHRNLAGATTLGQSGPVSNGNEGYSSFPKALVLLAPHHQILVSYQGHSLGEGSLTPLLRCIWYILHPQLSGINNTLKNVYNLQFHKSIYAMEDFIMNKINTYKQKHA